MNKQTVLKYYFYLSAALYLVLIIMGLFNWVPPNYYHIHQMFSSKKVLPISAEHLLGTDYFKKDIFTEFVFGVKSTFFAGMSAAFSFLIFGIFFGIASSYYENKFSFYMDKILEILNSFPKLIVLLIYIGLFGNHPFQLMILFGIISSPKLAELIKGRVLSLKKETFVDSSIALGVPHYQIIFKHILKYNCKEIIIGQFFYIYAVAVLIEASLSYVNLGFNATSVSWGYMLYEARGVISQNIFTFPWAADFNMEAFMAISGLTLLTLNMFYLSQYYKKKDLKEKGLA